MELDPFTQRELDHLWRDDFPIGSQAGGEVTRTVVVSVNQGVEAVVVVLRAGIGVIAARIEVVIHVLNADAQLLRQGGLSRQGGGGDGTYQYFLHDDLLGRLELNVSDGTCS